MDERTILVKALPSTEKCFSDQKIKDKQEQTSFYMLSNQRLTFQIAYSKLTEDLDAETPAELVVTSPIKNKITMYSIEEVPVYKPCYPDSDDGYLRKTPGFYPDLLMPCSQWHRVFYHRLRSFFVIIHDNEGIDAGKYPITFEFYKDGERLGGTTVTVEIIAAMLPEQKLIYTNWFHVDCLAEYYGCEIYSERHWKIIENFIKEAVSEGMNMILTPVLTPPLDTGVGWYRADTGLVHIRKTNEGYDFSYENLDRWIDLCTQCGIRYFEISHLFCQWSAAHAPQVTAEISGKKQKIFGWDTDALSSEYTAFIRQFLSDLLLHLQKIGVDNRCFFHIADEPNMQVYDSYTAAKNSVIDILEGYPVIDALSEYEFYKSGQIRIPIPAITDAEPFLEQDLPMRWTYYCCGQWKDVSNRFLDMPGQRTEIIGVQLYKYKIDGFLQWGYNFYNSASSWHIINPFIDLSGDNWVPAGDTFVVYPAPDGTAYRSLHGMQFSEGLEDLRLLEYCEQLIGRDNTMDIVNDGLKNEITFTSYPREADYLIKLKENILHAIENAIG